MNIDKAIEEIKDYNSATFETRFVTFSKALQLGIEALKARKVWQDNEGFDPDEALPGETKD